jgi:predicted nucleic acid-binding protein
VIVLDTTVLVYAVGPSTSSGSPAAACWAAVGRVADPATTTTQVVQEFAHVRARAESRDDAAALATAYIDLLSPLLPTDEAALRAGLAVFRERGRLGAFDAVLGAAATAAGAAAVVSADAAFADLPGVRHVRPDAAGVAALLRD